MSRRLAVIHLVALHLLIVCSSGFAARPLTIDELESQRTIAQADDAQAKAEQELAAWKLKCLSELRGKGHASWQEVAEQEVAVTSATASATAAEQYVKAVVDWQARFAKSPPLKDSPDYECIRLYMPAAARLVAWIATDVASVELTKQHLKNLSREHQSALDIDLSSLQTEIKTARQAVEAFGRNERDADLLRRAKIQLRLAIAKYESGKARKAAAKIVVRRMVLTRDSLRSNRSTPDSKTLLDTDHDPKALSQIGTRFVDASSDHELSQLVNAMAINESTVRKRIIWLQHQKATATDRVDALKKLSQHKHANRNELEQAKQQRIDLELQIEQAQQAMRLQQQIADHYQQSSGLRPTTNVGTTDNARFQADPNIVRHSLELQKLKLQAASSLAGIAAHRDYLVERARRIENIPERLRAPMELEHARHKIQGAQQQLAIVSREIAALEQEQQRFARQLRSQQSEQYQLVQVGGGQFIGREQFELARMWIAAVGFVGQSEILPYWPGMRPYIESSILFDCTSELLLDRTCPTAGLTSCASWRTCDTLLRRSVVSSVWNLPYSNSRQQLGTNWINNRHDLFCYPPYRTRYLGLRNRWSPRSYLAVPDRYRYRSFFPYANHNLYTGHAAGVWPQRIMSYQVGGPPRSTFPYRNSYLFRSAFRIRSNLYTSPYVSPSDSFSGLGYTEWLNSSCFD